MREKLWRRLRSSSALQKLYQVGPVRPILKAASMVLLPSQQMKRLQIQNGPCKGLVIEIDPRWEPNMWEGTFERAVQESMESLAGPGKVFYDVGGGFGIYSLLAARRGAQVFSFEPDLHNSQRVRDHIQINHFEDRIQLERVAVYSHTGTIQMQPADIERGLGCAKVLAQTSPEIAMFVSPCTKLDDFAQDHPAPHLLKIDVEGAESEVLKGAEQVFQNQRPHLLCEVHDAKNEVFITSWLKAKNYKFDWLEEGNFPRHLLALPD